MTMLFSSTLPFLLSLSLAACNPAPEMGDGNVVAAPIAEQQPAQATDSEDGLYAIITTRLGVIRCKLDFENAPLTVANFVGLATGDLKNTVKPNGTPFFDGTIFHRVISGFMIQGGDPTGTGMGGPGYQFPDELDPNTAAAKAGYVRGTMAMANSGPNTNGSQFFIMHKDSGLPLSYSIFGKVVSGLETVDAIATVARGANDKPDVAVSMTVKIEALGKAAKAFNAVQVIEASKAKFIPR